MKEQIKNILYIVFILFLLSPISLYSQDIQRIPIGDGIIQSQDGTGFILEPPIPILPGEDNQQPSESPIRLPIDDNVNRDDRSDSDDSRLDSIIPTRDDSSSDSGGSSGSSGSSSSSMSLDEALRTGNTGNRVPPEVEEALRTGNTDNRVPPEVEEALRTGNTDNRVPPEVEEELRRRNEAGETETGSSNNVNIDGLVDRFMNADSDAEREQIINELTGGNQGNNQGNNNNNNNNNNNDNNNENNKNEQTPNYPIDPNRFNPYGNEDFNEPGLLRGGYGNPNTTQSGRVFDRDSKLGTGDDWYSGWQDAITDLSAIQIMGLADCSQEFIDAANQILDTFDSVLSGVGSAGSAISSLGELISGLADPASELASLVPALGEAFGPLLNVMGQAGSTAAEAGGGAIEGVAEAGQGAVDTAEGAVDTANQALIQACAEMIVRLSNMQRTLLGLANIGFDFNPYSLNIPEVGVPEIPEPTPPPPPEENDRPTLASNPCAGTPLEDVMNTLNNTPLTENGGGIPIVSSTNIDRIVRELTSVATIHRNYEAPIKNELFCGESMTRSNLEKCFGWESDLVNSENYAVALESWVKNEVSGLCLSPQCPEIEPRLCEEATPIMGWYNPRTGELLSNDDVAELRRQVEFYGDTENPVYQNAYESGELTAGTFSALQSFLLNTEQDLSSLVECQVGWDNDPCQKREPCPEPPTCTKEIPNPQTTTEEISVEEFRKALGTLKRTSYEEQDTPCHNIIAKDNEYMSENFNPEETIKVMSDSKTCPPKRNNSDGSNVKVIDLVEADTCYDRDGKFDVLCLTQGNDFDGFRRGDDWDEIYEGTFNMDLRNVKLNARFDNHLVVYLVHPDGSFEQVFKVFNSGGDGKGTINLESISKGDKLIMFFEDSGGDRFLKIGFLSGEKVVETQGEPIIEPYPPTQVDVVNGCPVYACPSDLEDERSSIFGEPIIQNEQVQNNKVDCECKDEILGLQSAVNDAVEYFYSYSSLGLQRKLDIINKKYDDVVKVCSRISSYPGDMGEILRQLNLSAMGSVSIESTLLSMQELLDINNIKKDYPEVYRILTLHCK